jgi:hypothetical protein
MEMSIGPGKRRGVKEERMGREMFEGRVILEMK